MKFKCSQVLQEKLKLVLYVFRSYGVPDDVFNYMIDPLFVTDKVDTGIWCETDKKFVSIFEYDYDFSIKKKHEWKNIKWNIKMFEFNRNILGPMQKLISFGLPNQTAYILNDLKIYIVMSFFENDVNIYVCKYDNINENFDEVTIENIKNDTCMYYLSECNNIQHKERVKLVKNKLKI